MYRCSTTKLSTQRSPKLILPSLLLLFLFLLLFLAQRRAHSFVAVALMNATGWHFNFQLQQIAYNVYAYRPVPHRSLCVLNCDHRVARHGVAQRGVVRRGDDQRGWGGVLMTAYNTRTAFALRLLSKSTQSQINSSNSKITIDFFFFCSSARSAPTQSDRSAGGSINKCSAFQLVRVQHIRSQVSASDTVSVPSNAKKKNESSKATISNDLLLPYNNEMLSGNGDLFNDLCVSDFDSDAVCLCVPSDRCGNNF